MFLKKLFKKKKHLEEKMKITDISILDKEETEKDSVYIIDSVHLKEDDSEKEELMIKGLLDELERLKKELEEEELTYENYISSKLYESKPTLERLVKQVNVHAEEIEKKLQNFNGEEYYTKINDCLKYMDMMEKSIRDFLEEDRILRGEIGKYTQVVNKINAKKLQGAEFEAVKQKLEPTLNNIREQRTQFLEKESKVNQEIANLRGKVLELIEAFLKYKQVSDIL